MENNNIGQIGDEVIARYLLGKLSFEEEETIDLAMANNEFFERVTTIEEDLIDEYAQDRLSGDKRKLVEQRLFNTARQREQLAHSKALFAAAKLVREEEATERAAAENARNARTVEAPASGSWRQWLADLFRLPFPALAAGMGGLVLLFAGGAWVAYELRGQSGQIARLIERERELSQENNKLLASNTQQQEKIEQTNEQLTQAQTNNDKLQERLKNRGTGYFTAGGLPVAATEVIATRDRGSSDNKPEIKVGTEFKLTLKKDSALALLQTLITNDANSSYLIELKTESGLDVLRIDRLPAKSSAGDNQLKLAFPASLLSPGKYTLVVKGNDNGRTWTFNNLNVEKE